jgi:pSer/pThr/pTyr-binding forkhead associated (FHA) protein
MVADLNSMNGTLVNGSAIREHPLADGDEIRLGNTVLRFEAS